MQTNHQSDSRMGEETSVLGKLMADSTVLNKGTDDQLTCYGYCDNDAKKVIFYILVVLTFGLILLVFYWKPAVECYLKKSRCALYKADTMLLTDQFNQRYVCMVKTLNIEEELAELTDAYNREESVLPENHTDIDDNATLTIKQEEPVICYFDHQHVRFIWSDSKKIYEPLLDISSNTRCADLHEKYHGLSRKTQTQRRIIHGENSIKIQVKSYWRLLIEEVLNPFYIFQIASIILWSADDYYIYASCIFVISCISIGISLYETKRQLVTLHNMVSTTATTLTVSRGDGTYEDVPVLDLVPGDVVVIPSGGCVMTCDAVLMAGTCIVNESMLTGESVPVTKTPLSQQEDEEIYSVDAHKRHTLFAGTHVIQTRYYGHAKVLAVVVRTGFSTSKGELVRAILYPKPLGFKFYQDALRFILFLACVACVGMIYSIYVYIRLGAAIHRIILRVLDIITIVVPPALPAAMTVGTVYAQKRLQKKNIFCISPPRINFCGRLNVFCFDKTGTLTEDGLDMWGVVPVENNSFTTIVHDPAQMERTSFLTGMVTCHSLTIIDGEVSGDPLDMIMFNSTKWVLDEPGRDTSKFDTIMPTVVRPATRDTFLPDEDLGLASVEVGIVRQFTFSSSLQRMSVITRTLGESYMEVYCKGAPEMIASRCDPATVPEEFHDVLHQYTIQGLRVIAISYRMLDPKITWHQAQRISRDKVECNLTFLGLIVMENKLKPQTKPVIKTLHQANIRCIMVTGDMIKTAISVARNCGMVKAGDQVVIVNAQGPENREPAKISWESAEVQGDDTPEQSDHEETPFLKSSNMMTRKAVDLQFSRYRYQAATQIASHVSVDIPAQSHLAVSGKTFSVIKTYFPDLLPKICIKGTVFARMLPDQKCQLIEKLQELDYSVGMCGDGANDCEALKAAHSGISLSEAEASVAAPFTSRMNNIECVLVLIREGRAALVTSFGCFKYMALYSFIQFISILILYEFGVNLGDFQFLYIDLVITTTIAILMGYTKAYDRLVPARPEGSLVKMSNIMSILLQVVCAACFQVAAFLYLTSQPWYVPVKIPTGDKTLTVCWESTIIFITSSFQYIVVAFCFSKGPPFRKRLYTNIPFAVSLVVLTGFSGILLMVPTKPLITLFGLSPLDKTDLQFRGLLLTIIGGHFIAAFLIEMLAADTKFFHKIIACCRRNKRTSAYKRVLKEIQATNWPPIGQTTYMTANGVSDNTQTSVLVESIDMSSIN